MLLVQRTLWKIALTCWMRRLDEDLPKASDQPQAAVTGVHVLNMCVFWRRQPSHCMSAGGMYDSVEHVHIPLRPKPIVVMMWARGTVAAFTFPYGHARRGRDIHYPSSLA